MRGGRFWLKWSAALAAALGFASWALAQTSDAERLERARVQSQQAARRSADLVAAAARERDEATQARQQEAAIAARVQQAEADIVASQARIAIIDRQLAAQRATLAAHQGPVARLLAALQGLARRPAMIAVVRPGSVDDLVHVRAVLASTMPVVRARTAAIRADVDRTRRLHANAATAAQALSESRGRLEEQRLALTRLEAEHRMRSRALGRDALVESDRAIGLGERARDIVDLMGKQGDEATIRAGLAALPGPLPRPPRPGESSSPIDPVSWPHDAPPYRLPVSGKLITGFGELSDAGVRSRGLTLAPTAGAAIIAPAAGRVAFAGTFRGYGNIVIIDHGGGWTSLISGFAANGLHVGDKVAQDDVIGRVAAGDSPRVTVELRRRDRAVDMTPLIG
ncbi:MAG: peptidoglycan DD-metalloendopeptidase family protein [Pseudomonadota bacterium]